MTPKQRIKFTIKAGFPRSLKFSVPIYKDAALTVRHDATIWADEKGNFPDIYFPSDVEKRLKTMG